MRRPTTRDLRYIADGVIGRCPACGGAPIITDAGSGIDLTWTVRARCHGTFEGETFDLTEGEISPDRLFARVAKWISGVFKLDALPDVRELLHYNRGTLPEARS